VKQQQKCGKWNWDRGKFSTNDKVANDEHLTEKLFPLSADGVWKFIMDISAA